MSIQQRVRPARRTSNAQPVLFDAPGPKARRNALIWSAVASLAIGYVLFIGARRLNERGQFDGELWSPFFDPGHEDFNLVWQRLGEGFSANIKAAALAMVLSLAIGTVLALTRITAARGVRWFVVGFIELFRGIPVVIAIFFAFRVLPEFGVSLSTMWFLVIGLTAYNSVVFAEIIRAGINAVPKGQSEAAMAIGLTRRQSLNIVQLPQAVRIMLPALISQLVVILKDTSLGFIIAYPDLLRTSQFIGQNFDNPLQAFLVAAILFIIVNMILSWLATYLERRLSQRTRKAAGVVDMQSDAVTGA